MAVLLRLARELCPKLPDQVVARIGQRARTFADVFTIVDAGRLTGLAGDPAALLPAVDKVIDTSLERPSPSPEAVIVAWAGGLAHPRQAGDGVAIIGDAAAPGDPDLIRAKSFVRLADPDRQRYATAALALAEHKPALAQAFLDAALAIQADSSHRLAGRIVAGIAA